MLKQKVAIQFEYKLNNATLKCPYCNKRHLLKANKAGQISDIICKCGAKFTLPSHYSNTYHNKQAKAELGESKWI